MNIKCEETEFLTCPVPWMGFLRGKIQLLGIYPKGRFTYSRLQLAFSSKCQGLKIKVHEQKTDSKSTMCSLVVGKDTRTFPAPWVHSAYEWPKLLTEMTFAT